LNWNGAEFDLSGPDSKTQISNILQEKLKNLPHPELLSEISSIILALGDDPNYPIEIGSPYRMLSHNAIQEMSYSGLIEFGAHTHMHAILSRLPWKECVDEIERSVAIIHRLTSHPCKLFSYPNGEINDYNSDIINILKDYGVRAAITTIAGSNNCKTPVMELRRYGIGPNLSMAGFQMRVHHMTAKLRRVMPIS
jgi:peptidoglycan/xylan/chitin deacetylase (PgdA/CDA1 family)